MISIFTSATLEGILFMYKIGQKHVASVFLVSVVAVNINTVVTSGWSVERMAGMEWVQFAMWQWLKNKR